MEYLIICRHDDGQISVAATNQELPPEVMADAQPAADMAEALDMASAVMSDEGPGDEMDQGEEQRELKTEGSEGMPEGSEGGMPESQEQAGDVRGSDMIEGLGEQQGQQPRRRGPTKDVRMQNMSRGYTDAKAGR